jgi:alpha-beta hydrolase superfamily lysophospholipase
VNEERRRLAVPGGEVALVLHRPEAPGPAPCVVACHGLGASKDSDKYLLLGREFPAGGLALARFDFRGCGESTGREEETTIATRLEDLRAVVGFLGEHPALDGRLGLLGSSLGGFVALHLAAERGDGLPVVTWNAPAGLDELGEREDTPGVGTPFLLELAGGLHAVSPRGVRRHLVIQASDDDVVPLEHGTVLFARAAEPRDLVIVDGADHRLTDLAHRRAALARSLEWFHDAFKDVR